MTPSRWLRWEAVVCLAAARLALWVCPVRHLVRPFPTRPLVDPDTRERVRSAVKASIFAVHQAGWPPSTCAHRAVAAHWMLRRRGLGSTVCYGARTSSTGRLQGHMWLKDGSTIVVGEDGAAGYPLLVELPGPMGDLGRD